MRLSGVRTALALALVVEACLVAAGLWTLSESSYPFVAPLETRPLIRPSRMTVARADLVDCVHVFHGSAALGRDPLAEPGKRPVSARAQLAPDPGHFSWIVLEEKVSPRDALHAVALRGLAPGSVVRRQTESGLDDGLLSVFYDLGGETQAFAHNWSTVGVQEVQMAPLLPWTKRLDAVVLSAYDPEHCAGLEYVLGTSPDVLLLGPPLPRTADTRWGRRGEEVLDRVRQARRLRTWTEGLHRLTTRLRLLVYRTLAGGQEAALVVVSRQGVTVVAGAGGRPFVDLVELVERQTGSVVTRFIGDVGLEIVDDVVTARVRHLSDTHGSLEVSPGFGTSLEGLSLLSEALGSARVRPARLGARIRVGAP
ncbi:MAG: hypothetical protein EB084_01640 [Proteobacteria bacterium]|nr:hypothetical protein [Pseudomonadota bacterium]